MDGGCGVVGLGGLESEDVGLGFVEFAAEEGCVFAEGLQGYLGFF